MCSSRGLIAKSFTRRRLIFRISPSLRPWMMRCILVRGSPLFSHLFFWADFVFLSFLKDTQAGSQWDSLKHFAHQASKTYYNGLTHEQAATTDTNGTHNWCERGGIVGRGVLCDWLKWYEETKGKAPSPVSRHEIPVEEIEAALKWQGTTVMQGDILMVRSGYVRWHK